MRNVSVTMSDDLIEEIDKKRGDVPRSAYLRKIIVKAIVPKQKEALITA